MFYTASGSSPAGGRGVFSLELLNRNFRLVTCTDDSTQSWADERTAGKVALAAKRKKEIT